jgi:hypothetical protein
MNTALENLLSKASTTPSGCMEWQKAKNQYGYGVVWVPPKLTLAHRHAWTLAKGAIPAGMYVCHSCDNRSCVNPDHLFIGTAADNTADMIKKGRKINGVPSDRRGEKSATAKLNEYQVIEILTSRERQADIALRFGICQQTVSDIKRRKRWRYLHEQRA